MNKNMLESVMKLHGDTGRDLASYLGIARSTFSGKLNETKGAEFTQGEMSKIKDKYKLDADTMDSIFFVQNVSQKDTREGI